MRAEDNMAHRENKEDKEENNDKDKEKEKTKLFTCSLIQAAARAATMQGHAGFQRPRRRRLPPTRSPPSPPLTSSTTNCSSQESVLMNGSSLIKILFTSWSPLWKPAPWQTPAPPLLTCTSPIKSVFLSLSFSHSKGSVFCCCWKSSALFYSWPLLMCLWQLSVVHCILPPFYESAAKGPASSHMLHSTASATNVLLNNWH